VHGKVETENRDLKRKRGTDSSAAAPDGIRRAESTKTTRSLAAPCGNRATAALQFCDDLRPGETRAPCLPTRWVSARLGAGGAAAARAVSQLSAPNGRPNSEPDPRVILRCVRHRHTAGDGTATRCALDVTVARQSGQDQENISAALIWDRWCGSVGRARPVGAPIWQAMGSGALGGPSGPALPRTTVARGALTCRRRLGSR
jgi:hypothetical protein